MSDIETAHSGVPTITGEREPRPSPQLSYRKPRLQRLGAWNMFTRQNSPSTVDNETGTGFFELDFGR